MNTMKTEFAGIFSFLISKVDADGNVVPGSEREPLAPVRNLITNAGLNMHGAGSSSGDTEVNRQWCWVGTGTAAPQPTDTVLASLRAKGGGSERSTIAQPTAPYYVTTTYTYTFAPGEANGNLSEVGVGSDTVLYSRARITDTSGAPTTLTVLPDETLTVVYEVRCYPPTADTTGTVVIDGVTYNWKARASNVASADRNFPDWDAKSKAILEFPNKLATNGELKPITESPGGTSMTYQAQGTTSLYVAGTFSQTGTLTWDLGQGNVEGGIKTIGFKFGMGRYQMEFIPPIPKTPDYVLALTFNTSWARKAL